jgi:acyl-CoA thioester hydrolase
VDFRAPARLDDEIGVVTTIEKLGRASVQFLQQAWRGEQLLTTASVKVGCVDAATMRPRSLPDDVAAKMQAA